MVSATQIARVFGVIQRQTRPRLRCIRFGESPFLTRFRSLGISASDWHRFTTFKKNTTSSTVIQRTMVYYFSGRCSWAANSIYFGSDRKSRAGSPMIYKYTKCHTPVHTTTKYRAQLHTTNILKKFHNPNVLQKELLCKNVYNFIKTDSSIQQHIGPTTAIWLNKLSSQKVQPYMYWTISNSARVFIIINSLSYFCSMKSFTRLRRYKGPNVLSPVTIYPKQTNWLAHGPSSAFVCAFGQYNQIHSH